MKSTLIGLAALLAVATGCTASSHLTVGPLKADSWVQAHEWRDAEFHCEDGRIGSTLGFLSSEVGGEWSKCEEVSVGAGISWAKENNPQ